MTEPLDPKFVMSMYGSKTSLLLAKTAYMLTLLQKVSDFLGTLPDDMGRGSLNGHKVQLAHRLAQPCPTGTLEEKNAHLIENLRDAYLFLSYLAKDWVNATQAQDLPALTARVLHMVPDMAPNEV
jgi:hypothetical protein